MPKIHYIRTCREDVKHDEMITARLILHTDIEDTKKAYAAFRTAVAAWLKHDPEGKEAWQDTSESFNHGDFGMHEDHETLKKRLSAAGIAKATMEWFNGEHVGVVYDTILGDE